MKVDFARIDVFLLTIGVAAWVITLLFIWLLYHQPFSEEREFDFQTWKYRENRPHAKFSEFIGSEQAPRTYLSKVELSLGITGIALLALFGALRGWGVIS